MGSWVRKISWRRDRLPTPVFLGFPCDSVGKESTCNAGNLGSTPGLGRSGEGKGYPLQCSGLENFEDCIVHGITESDTTERLSLSYSLCYIFFNPDGKTAKSKLQNRFESESEVAQSCLTLCNPMDYSPPGSSIHGILQARVLEWVVISFSRRSSRPRDRTQVSRIVGRCFTV